MPANQFQELIKHLQNISSNISDCADAIEELSSKIVQLDYSINKINSNIKKEKRMEVDWEAINRGIQKAEEEL